jgi:hypothetical protein
VNQLSKSRLNLLCRFRFTMSIIYVDILTVSEDTMTIKNSSHSRRSSYVDRCTVGPSHRKTVWAIYATHRSHCLFYCNLPFVGPVKKKGQCRAIPENGHSVICGINECFPTRARESNNLCETVQSDCSIQ